MLTIDPGVVSINATVTTVNDSIDEPDETFTVTLTNATNATISDATAKGHHHQRRRGPDRRDAGRRHPGQQRQAEPKHFCAGR